MKKRKNPAASVRKKAPGRKPPGAAPLKPDLQRELNIEASLERVRNMALKMKKPDDMPEICRSISNELERLGIKDIRNVQTAIFYKDCGTYMNYQYYTRHKKSITTETRYTEHKIDRAFAAKMLKGKGSYSITHIRGNQKVKEWLAFQKTIDVFIDRYLYRAPSLSYYWYSLGPVALGISTYRILSDEETSLFRRFLRVFELAYRRYLDIEKAQAQVREAELQLALEKVRARTIAMRKSDELSETAQLLYEQFRKFCGDLIQMTICIVNEKERMFDCSVTDWAGGGKAIHSNFQLSIDEPALISHLYSSWKKGEKSCIIRLEGKSLRQWIRYRNKSTGVPVPTRQRTIHSANFSKGCIAFSSGDTKDLSVLQLLERFAGVLDLTYTRFLDLQKAEAQAREAHMEAALERLRAHTMAMHKSTDLHSVIQSLYKEFKNLGLRFDTTSIQLKLDQSKDLHFWSGTEKGIYKELIHWPYVQTPAQVSTNQAWQTQGFQVQHYNKKGKDRFLQEFFKIVKAPGRYQKRLLNTPGLELLGYFKKEVGIQLLRYSRNPFGKDDRDILRRFTDSFRQSYTRFLDLQKAEAQAREAEIQLALERVRSAAMAMHSSDELSHTITVLFEQLNFLGINPVNTYLVLYDLPNNRFSFRMTGKRGTELSEMMTFSFDKLPGFKPAMNAWKSGAPVIEAEYQGDNRKKWLDLVKPMNSKLPKENRLRLSDFPNGVYSCSGRHDFGSLGILKEKKASEEEKQLLVRFAKEFNQAYIRFLDLQKAEAQTREAEIQLALERVRARTMAMHNSEELIEVIKEVFEQMQKLDFKIDTASFSLNYKKAPFNLWMTAPNQPYPTQINIPVKDITIMNRISEAIFNKKEFFSHTFSFEEKNQWIQHVLETTIIGNATEERKKLILEAPGISISVAMLKNIALIIGNYSIKPYTAEENKIITRFAQVFEQTYTRFLDLQKAEAQAREAQIEAALERVRSRSVAMRQSEEIADIAGKIFSELHRLDLLLNRVLIWTFNETEKYTTWWSANPEVESTAESYRIDYNDNPVFINYLHAWQQRKPIHLFTLSGDTKKTWEDHLFEHTEMSRLPMPVRKGMREEGTLYTVSVISDYGLMMSGSFEPLSEANIDIIQRFGRVFQQSYTRYLDVQKAEAQARESQIQLALERVRAKTMAMQNSSELADASFLMANQVRELGIKAWGCAFHIYADNEEGDYEWFSNEQGYLPFYKTPREAVFKRYYENRRSADSLYIEEFKGKACAVHYEYLMTLPVVGDALKSLRDSGVPLPASQIDHVAYFTYGYLLFITYEPVPEAHNIFKRFAKEFEQTYTRFLDLQKAEAQAREAQIEIGLERVRARAMAMQNSEELKELIGTLFTELTKLDLVLTRCIIMIFNPETKGFMWWMANSEEPYNPRGFYVKYHEQPPYLAYLKAWREKQLKWQYILEGKEKREWDDVLFSETELSRLPNQVIAGMKAPERVYLSASFNNFGGLNLASLEPLSDEHFDILLRFAKVFDLTYTRFNDLQKAEAQAREARIEAALERVRAEAMAMHSSKDLADTVATFYYELHTFSLTPRRVGIGLVDKDTRISQISTMNTTEQGNSIEIIGKIKLEGHPVLNGIYDNWLKQKEYHPVLRGNEIKEYYQLIRPQVSFPDYPNDAVQYGHFFNFKEGGVYAWTEKEISEDELGILRRFTSVLSLAYKRYHDLHQAETSAKEAVKQAALDRIRADIASMRTVDDLGRITPLIWNELTILGIPFIRCGVFIMDENQKLIHTFLSTPDGKAIAAFHLPYDLPGKTRLIPENWKNKTAYTDHWNHADFIEFAHTLEEQKVIQSSEQYLSTIPRGGFYLHFFPFLQGMLYVGNTDQLGDEAADLIQSVADAFSTAYARYEDFNKLEAAKKQVDRTLNDLRQTQQQLLQSEKMASLGELTAGIAHEIQNPLNFVNNFSDVNSELIEEMLTEMKKGNYEEARSLSDDIKENEEKIKHHGKRADAIVKGMLQHSRASSGQKEPTDINILCDEYLRLAYHGLRAKDNSLSAGQGGFNAKFETNFDPSIEKVNVIPQEIGRVILNLINNAFYAVNEKAKPHIEGYEPKVILTTQKINNNVEIRVKDNGNGIPESIREKIFQPFFTTKPTGQGTGLGLSLSYEIVKAHGGSLEVNTITGSQSEFIIHLPLS